MNHKGWMGVALFVFLIGAANAAQGFENNTSTKPVVADQMKVSHVNEPATEIALLKEQNKIIKEYQSSLLDTVYMALGSVFTIAMLLAGFGWFTNFKLYENDKKSFRDEFEGRLKQVRIELEAKRIEEYSSILGKVDEKLLLSSSKIESSVTAFEDRINSKLDADSEELAKIRGTVDSLAAKQAKIKREVLLVEASLRTVEENVWEIKDIPENVLVTQQQGLDAAISSQEPYYVRAVLERMKITLKDEFLDKDVSLPRSMLELIDGTLVVAIKTETILASEVRELLAKVKKE